MKLLWLSLVLAVASVVQEKLVQSQEIQDTSQQPVSTTPVPKNATYWVTLSSRITPGQPLHVMVQILSGDDPVTVTVRITYTSYKENSTEITLFTSSPTDVFPGDAQTLQLNLPLNITVRDENYGSYKVVVNGQGRTINFEHEDYVSLQEKLFSIFVVTDKAIYKPGETVKIRALAIQPLTMKTMLEPMDITILDSKENIIQYHLGVTGKTGVCEESLKLADNTPLGDWRIEVHIQGQKTSKTFTVDNYVLPKFEVEVQPPAIPLSKGPPLTIIIRAKYTFGQPVIGGTADVRISVYEPWLSNTPKDYDFHQSGKLNSDGEFSFNLSTKQLANLVMSRNSYFYSLDYQQFQVEANVTETTTQRVQSGSAVMQMYSSALSAEFLTFSPSDFKPGLVYTGFLEVRKADGTQLSPMEASKLKVHFNVTYEVPVLKEDLETTTKSYANANTSFRADKRVIWQSLTRTMILKLDTPVQTLPESGLVTITFSLPAEAVTGNIEARFDQPYDNIASYYITKSQSPSNSFMQILPPTKTPKVGEIIPLKVDTTEPVTKLIYQVFSKGILVSSGTVVSDTPGGSKSLTISLEIIQAMTPSMNIVIFYIRDENSEFVNAGVSLSVDGMFQKNVSIGFNKDKVKPGDPINIIIKGEPNSTVFYHSNDKQVQLLKSGNELTQDVVRDDLAEYSYGYAFPAMKYMFICGWPSYFGGGSADRVFRSGNVIVFTNGLVPQTRYYLNAMDKGRSFRGNLAAPQAASAAGGLKAAEKVRKFFPENWIWDLFVIPPDSNGEIEIPATAPDSITSWLTNIFSVHPVFGLSVGSKTAVLTTYREMFVSLDLPPSIIRNESFCFTASVFSYYPEKIPVLLTFEKSEYVKGTYVRRDGDTITVSEESLACSEFHPDVAENEVRSSKFCFTPTATGNIPLKVSALTNIQGLSDAIEQLIKVKPEGVARSENYPSLINLTDRVWQKDVRIKFPPETVEDSQRITVNIAGNLLGPILDNLADLLKQPSGCGEQNMLNFAPAVSLLGFFYSTNTTTPEFLERAREYIKSGYQTEMTYEHHMTGGFSAFGNSDRSPSQWLTAFVVTFFAKAARLNAENGNIFGLDMTSVIDRSSRYIISNQNDSGQFNEPGIVFHKEMQGGSAEGEALTAYSLISLFNSAEVLKGNSTAYKEIQRSINLAAGYLASRINDLNDTFDICIVTYALTLVNHPKKDFIFAKMDQSAITGDGVKYWKRQKSVQDDLPLYPWSPAADSISIEMTCYALLTYVHHGIEVSAGLPVIRWLTSKRGRNGGFVSTQDTVICLQALASAATKFHKAGNYSSTVTVSYIDGDGQEQSSKIKISKDNEMVLQQIYISYKNNAPQALTINANLDQGEKGPSTALVDVTLDYNVKGETRAQCYELSHVLTTLDMGLELKVTIVALNDNATSMSILEVDIPAGYKVDLDELDQNKFVSLAELDARDSDKLNIYFDTDVINNNGISIRIMMYRTIGTLTKAEPRSYTCYDYYQPRCMQTKTYMMDIAPYCIQAPDVGICPYVK